MIYNVIWFYENGNIAGCKLVKESNKAVTLKKNKEKEYKRVVIVCFDKSSKG